MSTLGNKWPNSGRRNNQYRQGRASELAVFISIDNFTFECLQKLASGETNLAERTHHH